MWFVTTLKDIYISGEESTWVRLVLNVVDDLKQIGFFDTTQSIWSKCRKHYLHVQLLDLSHFILDALFAGIDSN